MGEFGAKDEIILYIFCFIFIYSILIVIFDKNIQKVFYKVNSLRKVKSRVTVDANVCDKYCLIRRHKRFTGVAIEYDVINEKNPDYFKKLYLYLPNKIFKNIEIGDRFNLHIITYLKGKKEIVEYESDKIPMIGVYEKNSKYSNLIFVLIFIPFIILFIMIFLIDKYYNTLMY